MKHNIGLMIIGILTVVLLTGCTIVPYESGEISNSKDAASQAAEVMTESEDSSLTIEDILAANTRENIFSIYKSLTLKEHDFVQNRDSEDYYSEKVSYRTGQDYFSLVCEELVASDDPEGSGYGCIVDNSSFSHVLQSYLTIDWIDYENSQVTINDDSTIIVTGEYEDYVITYDSESFLFLSKLIKNKDGSDWIAVEYEYASEDRDESIINEVKNFIEEKSGNDTVELVVMTEDGEKKFDLPKGFSAVLYSDDEYMIKGTDEGYFFQPLTEDTVLVPYGSETTEPEAEEAENEETETEE